MGRPTARRWIRVAGVSAAAVVVVIAGLVATGVISLGGSAGPRGVPFSQARSEATAELVEHYPGTWSLLAATGFDDDAPATVALANLSTELGTNCTEELPSGVNSSSPVYVPEYRGAWSSGLAPFWVLVYSEPSSGSYAVSVVVNGTAADATELVGSGCSKSVGAIQPLPATVADSPTAAQVAWKNAGSADVAADAHLSAMTMVAFGNTSDGGTKIGTAWAVEYLPCAPFVSGPTNETSFYVALDIATGAFDLSFSSTAACPTPP